MVADEVRKLAERTQGATHEISDMISGMQQSSRHAASAMQAAVSRGTRAWPPPARWAR